MPRPLIAACLITRNRAELLQRALESVRAHVDGIFVLDTGSRDETIPMLEAMPGVTVASAEWSDDFAATREQSFALAGPEFEWLMWLDDDDVVFGFELVRQKIDRIDPRYDGVTICRRDSLTLEDRWQHTLVRRSAGWRWEGRFHEAIVIPDRPARTLVAHPDEVWIDHWPPPRSEPDRYLRQCWRIGYETPEARESLDAETLLALGRSFAGVGRIEEATAALAECLERADDSSVKTAAAETLRNLEQGIVAANEIRISHEGAYVVG